MSYPNYPSGDPSSVNPPQFAPSGGYPQPLPSMPPPGYPQEQPHGGYPSPAPLPPYVQANLPAGAGPAQAPPPPYLAYQGMAAPPASSPRRARPSRRVVLLLLGVVLVLACGAYTAINLPRDCGLFGGVRHDMPCDIPLPSGVSFASTDIPPSTQLPPGEVGQTWIFKVSGASYQVLHMFYTQQLPANGWGCIEDASIDSTQPTIIFGEFLAGSTGRAIEVSFSYMAHADSSSTQADMRLKVDYAHGPEEANLHC